MKILRINALISMLCMLVTLTARAEGKVMIGLCGGEVASSTSIGVNYASDGIEAAALIPASMLEKYEDMQALGVNVGLASRLNVAKITVWVRETLDGENLFEASLTKEQGIKTGWNSVMGEATDMPQGKGLYVGYTLALSGASYPVSAVGEGCEGGFWMKKNGEWVDMCAQGYGALSIELIATASNLVPFDLALKQATLPQSVKIGETVPLALRVQNLGVEPVTQFTVKCSIENYEPISYIVDCEINPNDYAEIVLDFVAPFDEKCSNAAMSVAITEIAGGQDGDPSNNALTVEFAVNRFDFVKRLLIEEFSTERCTYCPQAAASLHKLLAEPEFDGKILAMVHHAGFGTDWLTIPVSNNYLWFYSGNAGNTFAPAFMYDRYSFNGESPVSNGTDDYSSIKQRANERLAVLPMTALEATAQFDADASRLSIHVEGERLDGYLGNRLTVCIIENNIAAKHQSGVSEAFTHQHVARDINEIWGYEIDWTDNAFTYDTSLYCNPSWRKENVEVIVFISNYDPTNYKNCAIDNATAAAIDWAGADGIEAVEDCQPAEYFTLSGLRVANPAQGLYIVKRGDKVAKEYVK